MENIYILKNKNKETKLRVWSSLIEINKNRLWINDDLSLEEEIEIIKRSI